ncbi:MAG: rhombosortase [Woeseiaceae bacterium]|nr:rhombosortase [Woeseiaceae bacterium]
MGLDQFNGKRSAGPALSAWILPLAIAATAFVIAAAGDAGRDALSYDRTAILAGEVWRLLTGHVTHLGWPHLALNMAGLVLVWYLVAAYLVSSQWAIVLAISAAGVDAGLWFFEPQLMGYVGLSGVLHGLLAAGIVAGLRTGNAEVRILGIVIVLKIGWEQFFGPLPGSEEASGGTVIVASHAWGALAGAVCAAILIRVRASSPI